MKLIGTKILVKKVNPKKLTICKKKKDRRIQVASVLCIQ